MRIPSNGARVCLALSVAAALCGHAVKAGQVAVQYVGGSDYNDPANWSPQVVPNNGNGGNTYRVTIGVLPGTSGPTSTTDVTIDELRLLNRGSLVVDDHSFTSGATSNDASVLFSPFTPWEFSGGIAVRAFKVATKSAAANLGTLANYDAATQTLENGGYSVISFDT